MRTVPRTIISLILTLTTASLMATNERSEISNKLEGKWQIRYEPDWVGDNYLSWRSDTWTFLPDGVCVLGKATGGYSVEPSGRIKVTIEMQKATPGFLGIFEAKFSGNMLTMKNLAEGKPIILTRFGEGYIGPDEKQTGTTSQNLVGNWYTSYVEGKDGEQHYVTSHYVTKRNSDHSQIELCMQVDHISTTYWNNTLTSRWELGDNQLIVVTDDTYCFYDNLIVTTNKLTYTVLGTPFTDVRTNDLRLPEPPSGYTKKRFWVCS